MTLKLKSRIEQSARLEAALTKVKAERGGDNVPDSQGR
jgi:hypothetical protein